MVKIMLVITRKLYHSGLARDGPYLGHRSPSIWPDRSGLGFAGEHHQRVDREEDAEGEGAATRMAHPAILAPTRASSKRKASHHCVAAR